MLGRIIERERDTAEVYHKLGDNGRIYVFRSLDDMNILPKRSFLYTAIVWVLWALTIYCLYFPGNSRCYVQYQSQSHNPQPIWGSVTTSDQSNSLRIRVDQFSHSSKTVAYCLYSNLPHRTRRSNKMWSLTEVPGYIHGQWSIQGVRKRREVLRWPSWHKRISIYIECPIASG